MAWTTRLANLFRASKVAADIDEELQFHLDARVRDNLAAGMTAAEARQEARRRFGSPLRAREASRDADVLVWLETIAQDARYAIRGLRKNPGVTAVTVLSLGLAIGATTAIFSLVNAVLLRALPYSDSRRIAVLWTANGLNGALEQNTSPLNFEDWKARTHTFEDMAAYRESDGPLMRPGAPSVATEWAGYAWVTGNFFSLLGRAPAIGRTFGAEDVARRSPVAVLSDRLWRRSFGGAPSVIGTVVNIGGLNVEVIGVMAGGFWFPSKEIDIWVPETLSSRWQNTRGDRSARFGAVFGRLRPGVTLEQARSDMDSTAAQLRREYPGANDNLGVNVVPLQVQINGKSIPFMLAMLFGAVLCVMLIACANVANLQLARGLARGREVAVRAALGAGRRRIVRQLLTESLLLSCAGGGLGLALVVWIIQALTALAPRNIVRLDEVHIDLAVLVFAAVLSLTTGLLFGLAPAIRISGGESRDSLHATSRNLAGGQSMRGPRGAFVVCQFALAVVLLAGAGLLIRSLIAVQSVDPGFGDRDVVTAHLRFHNTLPRARRVALYKEGIARLGSLPGVRAVGAISTMFWNADGGKFGLRAVEGRPPESREQWSALTWTTISGDYFQALGVPLVRGRFFTDQDRRESPPAVLINETMARRYWPREDAIGKRIKGFDARGQNDDWVTVVGVVKDVRSNGLERMAMAQIFEAQSQSLDETENLIVSAAAAAGIGEAIRKTIGGLDRTAVVSEIAPLNHVLTEQTTQRRFETYLLCAFAVLAMALAGAGIFGTMHYSVVQRTQELGIRVALGARRSQVLGMIFGEGVTLAAVGVGLGVAGSLALTRTLSSLLFGVTSEDPLTFAAVCVTLTALALAGCCVPAARAARVDPLIALRAE
jgi:predicted permease